MPSTNPIVPSDIESTIPESTDAICAKLESLWSLARKLFTFWEWAWDEDGNPTEEFKDSMSPVAVGTVAMWLTDTAPDGWVVLNGAVVSRTGSYADLFTAWGTRFGVGDGSTTWQLPNMTRKFPLGVSGSNPVGTTGGAEEVELQMTNLPDAIPPVNSGVSGFVLREASTVGVALTLSSGGSSTKGATDDEVFEPLGDGTPFSIIPPYFSVYFIAKL